MSEQNQHREHEYDYYDFSLSSIDFLLFCIGFGVFMFLVCAGIALMVWAGVDG